MAKQFSVNNTLDTSRKITGVNPCSEALKISGAGLLLALGVHTFIAESRYISSHSMEPTLQVNDRLLVDKVTYHFGPPKRNDLIVFNPPNVLLKQGIRGGIIKRVIGLPGERVEVKGGQVYLNQRPLQEEYLAAKPKYTWGPQVVPHNSYLVLGDNRNQSYDSHYWGYVPRDRIVGQAVVRYWPLPRAGVLPFGEPKTVSRKKEVYFHSP